MTHGSDALDPALAALIEAFEAEGLPPWHTLPVEEARRLEDELFGPSGEGPEMASIRDLAIEGPDGDDLPIRAYLPRVPEDAPPPTLVFYHGGGWTLGTLDSCEDICLELADRVGAAVLSVDYRLAPEHPFPAAVDDAYAAVCWAGGNADELGADPDRIGVAGTSAGGNLAAATAMRVRDAHRGEGRVAAIEATVESGRTFEPPSLSCQGLFYPITDPSFDTDSYREHGTDALLSERDMRWFWSQYLRSPIDAAHPYASILDAPDLSELAPAVVATAGHDVLRDEGAAYARRLADAGVPIEHLHYPALTHGFLSVTDEVPAADVAMDAVANALRKRLSASPDPSGC